MGKIHSSIVSQQKWLWVVQPSLQSCTVHIGAHLTFLPNCLGVEHQHPGLALSTSGLLAVCNESRKSPKVHLPSSFYLNKVYSEFSRENTQKRE